MIKFYILIFEIIRGIGLFENYNEQPLTFPKPFMSPKVFEILFFCTKVTNTHWILQKLTLEALTKHK